jgi:hypothetical protein
MNIRRGASAGLVVAALMAGAGLWHAAAPATAAAQPSPAPAACNDGKNRWLYVRNLNREFLYAFQTRGAFSSQAWGADLLGSAAVLSGSTAAILMPSERCACHTDVKVTFIDANGPNQTYTNVPYCSEQNGNRQLLIVGDER